MHDLLIRRGPEVLVILGIALGVVGIVLDREWLTGFGLVAVILGVVLPRVRGALEAGPEGIKVGEILDPTELRALVKAKGRDLPADAVSRAERRLDEVVAGMNENRLTSYSLVRDLVAEGVLTETARLEWGVTLVVEISDLLYGRRITQALTEDEGMVLLQGPGLEGEAPSMERFVVLVNAASSGEAQNRVRRVVEPWGRLVEVRAEPHIRQGPERPVE